jgi:hypothetical protein
LRTDNLHGYIGHFAQKPLENRSPEENIHARPLRLTEDHVGDPFSAGEFDQSVHSACGLHADNGCAKALRKRHVSSERVAILGRDSTGALFRRLDVDSI